VRRKPSERLLASLVEEHSIFVRMLRGLRNWRGGGGGGRSGVVL
jgi:hypothetical protein